MADFTGEVVLVTGGTSGIGRATALAFARGSAKVVVSGRREPEGAAVVAEIAQAGGDAIFVQADGRREADVKALVAATVARFGRLDIAFNNAGVEQPGTPIHETTEAADRRIFDINVPGVLLSMTSEVPELLKAGGGAVINTSSIAGHTGMAGAAVDIASKHTVGGLTKSAALEYAKRGVRVTAVAPAAIVTDMIPRFVGGGEADQGEHLANLHPVGRMGRPEEVAAAVLPLAGDKAKFITGISRPVGDGFLAQ